MFPTGFLLSILSTLQIVEASFAQTPDSASHLKATSYITKDSPEVQRRAALFMKILDPRERAIAIHDWVRDEIKFGFAPEFWNQSADEVLSSRVGFCNTKSTLFVTLLRAAGIPARQVFVSIRGDILFGFVDPGVYVDHSYAEVYLDGVWVKTDSYIVDQHLFDQAQILLKNSGRELGWGTVIGGTTKFDGRRDSFSQFLNNRSIQDLSDIEFGSFSDVGDFYARAPRARNGGLIERIYFRLMSHKTNRKIEVIRSHKSQER